MGTSDYKIALLKQESTNYFNNNAINFLISSQMVLRLTSISMEEINSRFLHLQILPLSDSEAKSSTHKPSLKVENQN